VGLKEVVPVLVMVLVWVPEYVWLLVPEGDRVLEGVSVPLPDALKEPVCVCDEVPVPVPVPVPVKEPDPVPVGVPVPVPEPLRVAVPVPDPVPDWLGV
jgi:hypothetical protein